MACLGDGPMKKLILIRHAQADGKHRDSPLTNHGVNQAYRIAEYFMDQNLKIDQIISSPYMRALETIRPYAREKDINIKRDKRLSERVLSSEAVEDWLDAVETSFEDPDYALPGGESSSEALSRILEVIEAIKENDESETAVLVTHGNLLMILLAHFDKNYGFKQWRRLKKPDLFIIEKNDDSNQVKHIW